MDESVIQGSFASRQQKIPDEYQSVGAHDVSLSVA